MSRLGKAFLGILTVYPIVHMVLFVMFVVSSTSQPTMLSETGMFEMLMISHGVSMLLIFGLMAFYVVHALTKNESLDRTERLLWAVILFMGNMVAMPIYYGLHILPDKPGAIVV